MGHSFGAIYIQVIFSTRERARSIPEAVQPRLWDYMGGIVRDEGARPVRIGGVEDHTHLLVMLPPVLSVSALLQQVKGGSSRWMNQQNPQKRFEWQEGYGAFSVSASQVPATVRYIDGQREHHRRCDFKAEFISFLKKYGVEYDERYVFG